MLIGFLILWGSCSPKIVKKIDYDTKYNNKEKIENGIQNQGVTLTFFNEEANGKGLLTIRDSKNQNKKETTFTTVRQEHLENGTKILISEIPTNEGMYEIQVMINGENQESKFRIIKDWRNKIEFETKSSIVKINKPLNSNGLLQVKLEYEGQQIGDNRTIKLSNEFYIQMK